jgi:hypothetical protein
MAWQEPPSGGFFNRGLTDGSHAFPDPNGGKGIGELQRQHHHIETLTKE